LKVDSSKGVVGRGFALFTLSLGLVAGSASAQTPTRVGDGTSGWARKAPDVESAVRAGKPLVVEVFVPLCSDQKGGPCGKHKGAGEPENLEDNLYWGAVWGARRYLARSWLGWKQVEQTAGSGSVLERVVLSRQVDGSRWGATGQVEQIVVLHGFHGDAGKQAFDAFRDRARGGGSVSFGGGSGARSEAVSVVGFMGRNPLLKNGKVPLKPELPEATESPSAIPSFSIAPYSRETFGAWLAQTGSPVLLAPRGAVASEAYVLHEVLKGIGDNEHTWRLWQEVADTYVKYQRVPRELAKVYWAPFVPKSFGEGASKPPPGR
jgi:hypothetical protein